MLLGVIDDMYKIFQTIAHKNEITIISGGLWFSQAFFDYQDMSPAKIYLGHKLKSQGSFVKHLWVDPEI